MILNMALLGLAVLWGKRPLGPQGLPSVALGAVPVALVA